MQNRPDAMHTTEHRRTSFDTSQSGPNMLKVRSTLCICICTAVAACGGGAAGAGSASPTRSAQVAPAPRPTPPTRDPHTPGFVDAKELPDGAVPPADVDGNFIIGATHATAPEMTSKDGVPHGTVYNFTMSSSDSRIYPGVARDSGTFGTPDPRDSTSLVVTTSHPATYTRRVSVYVPKQYVAGQVAPFIVGADGPDPLLFTALDNLIATISTRNTLRTQDTAQLNCYQQAKHE